MILIKRHILSFLTLLCMLSCTTVNLFAQAVEEVVKPIKLSKISSNANDIYGYVAFNSIEHKEFYTATNSSVMDDRYNMYSTYFAAGVTREHHNGYIRTNLGLGFMYERFADSRFFSENHGIYTKWLTAEAGFTLFSYFLIGFNAEFLLDKSIRRDDVITYAGIYEDCIKDYSIGCFTGVCVRVVDFKLEVRAGTGMTHLSVNKIAHYNLNPVKLRTFYLEFRLSYRIFTNGDKIKDYKID